MTCTFENNQPGTHVLIYRLANHFVLSLEVVHAVLLVGKLPAALGTLERVLLAALVLEVPVQVVVPVVGPLAVGANVDTFRAVRICTRWLFGSFAFLLHLFVPVRVARALS